MHDKDQHRRCALRTDPSLQQPGDAVRIGQGCHQQGCQRKLATVMPVKVRSMGPLSDPNAWRPAAADKVGRKPVVVLANFIMGIATLGLGLAPTYWLAVMARCLGGAANGSGV